MVTHQHTVREIAAARNVSFRPKPSCKRSSKRNRNAPRSMQIGRDPGRRLSLTISFPRTTPTTVGTAPPPDLTLRST
jgi:hypothetical protein